MTNKYFSYLRILVASIFVVALSYSCSDYNKVLKGNDYELKYKTALELYENGECVKALPLFDELLSVYRFTSKGEDVFYYYAKANFCTRDYPIAEYYFKSFVKSYPKSERVEECAFLTAICSQRMSPKYNLDPTPTKNAINELQLYLNRYPESEYADTCNVLMDDLRFKLERKYYEQAELYYKTEKYKSAIVAFENLLKDYPDNDYIEQSMFLMVKSNFLYAENSIESKKAERYSETIKSYLKFVDSFKESDYLKTLENIYKNSLKEIEKLKNT